MSAIFLSNVVCQQENLLFSVSLNLDWSICTGRWLSSYALTSMVWVFTSIVLSLSAQDISFRIMQLMNIFCTKWKVLFIAEKFTALISTLTWRQFYYISTLTERSSLDLYLAIYWQHFILLSCINVKFHCKFL